VNVQLPGRHRVNARGCREILDIDVTSSEDSMPAGVPARPVRRRLVRRAARDQRDHARLVNAIGAVLSGTPTEWP
jgi:transposase-like protein